MSEKEVLLTSVFGPYCQDDEWGSRKVNPMELYHNQVTRTQGAFSLRLFHRSWGIMIIQVNLEAPCVVLDFPTKDRFIEELCTHWYDIIGITSITTNLPKVKEMCRLIRKHQPDAEIVIGGHIANMPDLHKRIDADHIVGGDGIRWLQEHLGEDNSRSIRHPMIVSGLGARSCGISLSEKPGRVAATVIPSVGCPLGCNFCSTSAMFGGKGKCVNFYETGKELFHIMCQLEKKLKVYSFFIMDENFLLHKKRAMQFLELMEQHNKSWALYVFSSANAINLYTIDELIRLGVSWVWMGLEGEDSQYTKLEGVNTFDLVKNLQSHGIHVLGSTIIGLENHTSKNINDVIRYAVRHDTDFHQFMLYTPVPGTPLHAELSAQGRMRDERECHISDIHGQEILNYDHPAFNDEQTREIMIRAFDRDFQANGPSVTRIVRTTFQGWLKHKNHSDLRIRRRFKLEAQGLSTTFSALLGATQLYYSGINPHLYDKISSLLSSIHREFGWLSRASSSFGGRYLFWKIRQEERRLEEGWTYEPPTFYEGNIAAVANHPELPLCSFAEPLAFSEAE